MDKKEFYNSLSDDVKQKLKACTTEEEMLKVLGDNRIELDEETLSEVSAGSKYHRSHESIGPGSC